MSYLTENWNSIKNILEKEHSNRIYLDDNDQVIAFQDGNNIRVYGYLHTDWPEPYMTRKIIGGSIYGQSNFLIRFIDDIKEIAKAKWDKYQVEITLIGNFQFCYFSPRSLSAFPSGITYTIFRNKKLEVIDISDKIGKKKYENTIMTKEEYEKLRKDLIEEREFLIDCLPGEDLDLYITPEARNAEIKRRRQDNLFADMNIIMIEDEIKRITKLYYRQFEFKLSDEEYDKIIGQPDKKINSILDLFNLDISNLPYETFDVEKEIINHTTDVENQKGEEIIYYKKELSYKECGLFNFVIVSHVSPDGYIVSFESQDMYVDINEVIRLVHYLHLLYGDDVSSLGKFKSKDGSSIKKGFWIGRMYSDCMLIGIENRLELTGLRINKKVK